MADSVAALGTFDGIHLGHRAVLNGALRFRGELTPVCLSFHGTPKNAPGAPVPLLLGDDTRARMLREIGFARVELFDFSRIRRMSPEAFLRLITETYGLRAISCGFNYRFGADAAGDTELLARFCAENGIELHIARPVLFGGEPVSATRIREAVGSGQIERANAMLGYPFFVDAQILHGEHRGHTLGFPTINQHLNPDLVCPRHGVYASRVTLGGAVYAGLTNIGGNPTFGPHAARAETYLCGFSAEVYGQTAKTELLRFVRPEMRFRSPEQLRGQIALDLARAFPGTPDE